MKRKLALDSDECDVLDAMIFNRPSMEVRARKYAAAHGFKLPERFEYDQQTGTIIWEEPRAKERPDAR